MSLRLLPLLPWNLQPGSSTPSQLKLNKIRALYFKRYNFPPSSLEAQSGAHVRVGRANCGRIPQPGTTAAHRHPLQRHPACAEGPHWHLAPEGNNRTCLHTNTLLSNLSLLCVLRHLNAIQTLTTHFPIMLQYRPRSLTRRSAYALVKGPANTIPLTIRCVSGSRKSYERKQLF
jgi:hypothetical protein